MQIITLPTMSVCKSKCGYSNNVLHFLKCAVPLRHEAFSNYMERKKTILLALPPPHWKQGLGGDNKPRCSENNYCHSGARCSPLLENTLAYFFK